VSGFSGLQSPRIDTFAIVANAEQHIFVVDEFNVDPLATRVETRIPNCLIADPIDFVPRDWMHVLAFAGD
jgi:hypothetical protein